MKKSSIVNLTIVCFLLTLCIGTLLVIYASAPETSIVLFDENFNSLDESKWTREAVECQEDSDRSYYVATDNGNRYTANDGTLHFLTTDAENVKRSKRDTDMKCNTCINWKNGTLDCFSSEYSSRLQTKAAFQVFCGQLKARFRFPTDRWIKLAILIVPARNETEAEETLGGFIISRTKEETETNCSTNIQIFFGKEFNETAIKSVVTDSEFHSYQIEWNDSRMVFSLDGEVVLEKAFQTRGNNTCSDERPDQNVPINQPFHIRIGVDFGGNDQRRHGNQSDNKRFFNRSSASTVLVVDQIRFSKLLG